MSRDAVAGLYVNHTGELIALSNQTWVGLGYTLSSNQWYRLTVRLDYVAQRWAVYGTDGTPNKLSQMIATNLTFSSTSTNTYLHRFRVKN